MFNVVADAASRSEVSFIQLSLEDIAKAQSTWENIVNHKTQEQLRQVTFDSQSVTVLCFRDGDCNVIYVPKDLRKQVFDVIQSTRHPVICATIRLIDRATRWIEVKPMKGIEAADVATAFIDVWVNRYLRAACYQFDFRLRATISCQTLRRSVRIVAG